VSHQFTPSTRHRRKRDRSDHELAVSGALERADVSAVEVLTQLAHSPQQGIVLVDTKRQVQVVNEATRDMLGYEGNVPDSLASVIRDVDLQFAVGEVIHDRAPVEYETYVPNPDRLLRFQLLPVLKRTGEVALVLVLVHDVTRLRHLETVRRDFVANVSHELRTPITSINLLVETLQTTAWDDRDAAKHFLQRIEIETVSMMRLVEELLELSRLESGRLSLRLDEIDVAAVLDSVARRLEPAAREKQVHIERDVQVTLPKVQADGERLEQVVMNLVHNAIKFTPAGGHISLRAARSGRGVLVEVADTGSGMDASDAERIFERFYKVDKGRNRAEGSGLGLAIAKNVIEMHGSRLHVVSEPGHGSRFTFALPMSDIKREENTRERS